LLSFDDTLGVKKNTKILFIEEDYLTAPGMLENPTFVPIKLINNSKNLSKVISEEVIKYYNKYNILSCITVILLKIETVHEVN